MTASNHQNQSKMSKYASLPDIDTAPDVYETPDISTVLVTERDEDSDTEGPSHLGSSHIHKALNEDINQNALDQSLARKRFGTTAGLDGTDADFSMSLLKREPRRSSALYPPPPRRTFETGEYSIIPRGYTVSAEDRDREEETPLQRLRRLRFEIEQLEEELEAQVERPHFSPAQDVKADSQNPSAETTTNSPTPGNPASRPAVNKKGKLRAELSPAELLAQLQHMRGDLGKLSASIQPSEQNSSLATNLKQREAYAKNLLQQLTGGSTSDLGSSQRPSNRSSSGPTGISSANAAKLDARLNALENLLGSTSLLQASSTGDVTLPPPLLVTLSKLEHQLSLLTQPRHLDSVSRRVKVIVTDLERVHEARRKLSDHRPLSLALASGITVVTQAAAGNPNVSTTVAGVPGVVPMISSVPSGGQGVSLPPDGLHKLERLYNLLPRIDPLLPLVPHLLIRLRSLADLHVDAHQFGQNLKEAERALAQLGQRSKELEEILKGVESSVEENEVVVKNNLRLVEERIEGLVKMLDRLADRA
ncbi:hypothetical protein CROQUDRAFT_88480 [Cronartium quercuum f. sp. fusiforme G11]|uniref:Uncharacterized protein n=1 Tax=Cronartium quercuum f. sp. fusiforme G11 TaxID=708437 RepID=A0A9P6NTB7_9BASI|nr:hypothetical protein CROQUDRAFT_88480 [Cronartium quercuum f. sp. fusiforme G11]